MCVSMFKSVVGDGGEELKSEKEAVKREWRELWKRRQLGRVSLWCMFAYCACVWA